MSLPTEQQRPPKLPSFMQMMIGRKARRQANNWLYTVVIIGAIILVNVLSVRFPWRYDATKDKTFTLAPETTQLLSHLPGEIHAVGFYGTDEQDARSYVEDLLKEYQVYAKGKLTYEMVDPATSPSLVKQYQLSSSATLVLTYNGKQETIDQYDLMGGMDPTSGQPQMNGEQAITNAMVRLTSTRKPKAYFLDGHGERSLNEFEKQMQAENYVTEPVNMATQPDIPTDADVLVIAGPTRDFTAQELDGISKWLDTKGGRLTVMLDPGSSVPNLENWLKQQWGVTVQNDLVVDPSRHYMYDAASPVPSYDSHPITSKIDSARLAMVLPGARSLTFPQEKSGFKYEPLLTGSSDAFGKVNLKSQSAAKEPGDLAGPLTMAVAVTREKVAKTDTAPEKPEVRLVVTGSSGFLTDNVLGIQGNLDFGMGVLGWLTDNGGALTIRPKQPFTPPMFMTGKVANFLFLGTVIVMPLLFLAAGGAIWYRRRHL